MKKSKPNIDYIQACNKWRDSSLLPSAWWAWAAMLQRDIAAVKTLRPI